MTKVRVLVIGSGERAQSAILPALWCLRDTHEIIGVYGHTKKTLSLMGGALQLTVETSMAKLPIHEAEVIMVAITKENVPSLLHDLSAYDTEASVLMLDTPVIPLSGLASARFFARFKKVLVSEDTIALPPLLLARSIIEAERIGALKSVYFFHNGYKYHAVASIKALTKNTRTGIIRSRKFYNGMQEKEFHLPNGVRALLYEPREYNHGKLLIEGAAGVVADYDFKGGPHTRIEYLHDGSLYKGMLLDGAPVPANELDARYLASMTQDVPLLSLMNSMKLRGLMDLIVAATKDHSPFHYHPIDGILDNALMQSADKLGFAIDPRI
jgi:hypothetical protein